MKVALGDYLDEATNAARGAEEITVLAFQSMEDALTAMVTKGKLDFASLADSIVADITRIAIKQAILAPLAMGLDMGMGPGTSGGASAGAAAAAGSIPTGSGWLVTAGQTVGSWLASWFHEGGIVGQSAPPMRAMDASLFVDAPRYHAGGYQGLKPDEMPAILQRGERVLSRQQVAREMGVYEVDAAGRQARRPPMNVVMNITTPDAASFRASQGQIAADAVRTLARVQRRNL